MTNELYQLLIADLDERIATIEAKIDIRRTPELEEQWADLVANLREVRAAYLSEVAARFQVSTSAAALVPREYPDDPDWVDGEGWVTRASSAASPTPLSIEEFKVIGAKIVATSGSAEQEELEIFLKGLETDFDRTHVDFLRLKLSHLRLLVAVDLALPIVQPGEDGAIQLAWNRGGRYVDVDVFPDGTSEWFFRDRTTNKFSGSNGRSENTPDTLIAALAVEGWAKP